MADSLSQKNRVGEVIVESLPQDTFVLTRFDGQEGLSELFEYRVEILTEIADFDFDDLIGKNVSVRLNLLDMAPSNAQAEQKKNKRSELLSVENIRGLEKSLKKAKGEGRGGAIGALAGGGMLEAMKAAGQAVANAQAQQAANASEPGKRFFDGLLTEAQWLGVGNGGHHYRLTLRPWFWVLTKRTNCLIFHEMSVDDIIRKVLQDHGPMADFDMRLNTSYPKLEYTVQYRESDFAFVCRLMEMYGIFYYFVSSRGKHQMVIGDSDGAYDEIVNRMRPFYPLSGQYRRGEEHIYHLVPERRLTSGKYATKDYNFKRPTQEMKAEEDGDATYEQGKKEVFGYPGKYLEQSQGKKFASANVKMLRGGDKRLLAAGDCMSFYPGGTFELQYYPHESYNKEYLLTRCTHTYYAESYRSGAAAESDVTYQGQYEFAYAERPFVPPVVTEKPCVLGPQTAKVVGSGEIDCDEYGRILVRFHWDRKNDQSMRCRVAQVWAGSGWGAIFIPRVGMEVIVQFLEGDPDNPIIIGCVYNADNMPPFKLADNKTINGWKSNSTTGGGGYNELVFDDEKGSELWRAHAQKNMEVLVLNDEHWTVKRDRTTLIERDDTHTVDRNLTTHVKGKESRTVDKDRSTAIHGSERLIVDGEIFIESKKKITLKVGGSTIVMDGQNIKLESMNINAKAGMELKTHAGMDATHTATKDVVIKGLMVKINS